jgi:cytochrome c556
MKFSSLARTAACLSLGAAVYCVPSFAQQLPASFAKPEDAVKYRQSALTVMAAHFSRIKAVIDGKTPFDAAKVQGEAKLLQSLAALPWEGFDKGTEGGDALPEIWSDAAGFKQKQQGLIDAMGKLAAAAGTGDMAKLREAFGGTGASCKACHDNYRKKR